MVTASGGNSGSKKKGGKASEKRETKVKEKAAKLAKLSKKLTERQRIQKGLRHFSLKVCEKVEEQRVTTYNKVWRKGLLS